MSEYLFSYGTLRSGHAPEEITSVVERLRPVGKGYVFGQLYDLGEFPGIVLDSTSPQQVFGTISFLPDDPNCLRALDAYEGFDAEYPDTSLFLRTVHPVRLAEGGSLPCWIYIYNGSLKTARAVESRQE
jgi:gamma-glutamylcyclotransferase (GGCT)/AIG2-like uncharacterized protein YtfP